MKNDKKDPQMGSCILCWLRAIGDAFVHDDVPEAVVTKLLERGSMLSSMWLLALTIGLLIVASAFFSSAETALTAALDAAYANLPTKEINALKLSKNCGLIRKG